MRPGGTKHLAASLVCILAAVPAQAARAEEPAPLARLIAAAQAHGDPLASRTYGATLYDLRSVVFIGCCRVSFGTVQIAQFSYQRAGGPDGTPPPRGHSFVLFFDGACRLRLYWEVDTPADRLSLEGTVLWCGEEMVFDFAHPPARDTILMDGRPQTSPALAAVWKRAARSSRQRELLHDSR